MIPADVASQIRLIPGEQPAPVPPVSTSRQLTDVLSDLVPGQRLLANILAVLPNGSYRALIAQRDVTLALPFSAKPGDALELEVVESDGKINLAFVGDRSTAAHEQAKDSVSTTLSSAGRLISDLMGDIGERAGKQQPLVLNGSQPLFATALDDAALMAPMLKDALTQSGMFYEAHQVRWLQGEVPAEALLSEPQGKLSQALKDGSLQLSTKADGDVPTGVGGAAVSKSVAGETHKGPGEWAGIIQGNPSPPDAGRPEVGQEALAAKGGSLPLNTAPVAAELAPLVRQQLDALATQNFVWQGQVWPGQQMHWEIQEDQERRQNANDDSGSAYWKTRLSLSFPGLGGIDAVMRLGPGGRVDLTVVTENSEARETLVAAAEGLRSRFDSAGLNLEGLIVRHEKSAE